MKRIQVRVASFRSRFYLDSWIYLLYIESRTKFMIAIDPWLDSHIHQQKKKVWNQHFIFHLIFRMCSRVSRETLILSIVCMCSRIILGSRISCYDIFLVPPRIFCTLGGLLFHISFWTCSVFMLPAYPYVSLRIRLTSNSWSSVKFILLAGGKGYLWATSESYHNAGNLNFHLWKGTWRRLPCS